MEQFEQDEIDLPSLAGVSPLTGDEAEAFDKEIGLVDC